MKKQCRVKGSITVEAAIVLPISLCVVLSIVMVVRVVCIHAQIQHALMETAEEIAASAYIYHMSGIRDLHDAARNGLQERSDIIKEQTEAVFDILGSLGGEGQGSEGQGSEGQADDAGETGDIFAGAGEATGNPADELKNIAAFLAEGAFDDIKTGLFTPLVKIHMKKYLEAQSGDADERLHALGVTGGFEGLDFSGSSFLEDREEDIDIAVRYSVDLPIPVNVLPKLELVQRATAKAWLTGDEAFRVLGPEESGDDIWSLDNFTRGRRIRSIYGGNLPASFPVISSFENSKAVMIKSMDLTDESYQDAAEVMETIDSYIRELSGFKGREEPWGSGGIVIKGSDIKQKELLLVVPTNLFSAEVEQLLSRYASRTGAGDITIRVERYGKKQLAGGGK